MRRSPPVDPATEEEIARTSAKLHAQLARHRQEASLLRRTWNWLDDRAGLRGWLLPIRRRRLPGGARWEYSTASCLLWLLVVEVVTGLLLMTTYSPGSATAWASVHYIDRSAGGGFIRGVHYFASQALLILFAVHMVRVLLRAAFRAPFELIWITGLLLTPLVIGLAVTGNPLSASIKGASQIEVEGSIIGSTPLVGPMLKRALFGGEDVGQLTFTHLYFLHVALLPLLVGLLLIVHIAQIYRHGLSAPMIHPTKGRAVRYWPYQTVRNMTVLAIVVGVVSWLAWRYGAPLDAPADSELPYTPRPEWYLLFLFELRRHFSGQWEFVATIILPLLTLGLLLSMPLIDRLCTVRTSAVLRVLIVFVGLGGWIGLTLAAVMRDRNDPEFAASRAESARLANRACQLADQNGVPPEGAAALLRRDPQTRGPMLFKAHCASCHGYGENSSNASSSDAATKTSAPDLANFASRAWLTGMLDPAQHGGPRYFGNTKFAHSDMIEALTAICKEPRGAARLGDAAVALSAEAALPSQAAADAQDAARIATGRQRIAGKLGCTDCHRFHEQGDLGSAADLTGYGSRDWLIGIISNPEHERFYGKKLNDRMPAFAENPQSPEGNVLTGEEIELLAKWLRGE
ncbi:MAG TPA: cytochrome b N-terminal domain-containing protein [Pirellulales bacterium]|jgi:ubiquinol-cytochrome c reductase cytochrome b subunit|nr:cytochrome b N-terminal domain-containing protein [Pirellulales bacterium]